MLSLTLALVLLLLVSLAAWAVVQGYGPRSPRSRTSSKTAGSRRSLEPQSLAALAQPYRSLMAEALEIERDVHRQVASAPPPLRDRLAEVEARIGRLIAAALPQARQGTVLAAYLLKLGQSEPQRAETERAAAAIEEELKGFVASLRKLRAKVYGVLTGAARLATSGELREELDEALFELGALEEAFRKVREVT